MYDTTQMRLPWQAWRISFRHRIASKNQFLIALWLYNMPDSEWHVQAVVQDETIWLTQKAMAQLFGVQIPAINKHLKNIFDEGELFRDTTISKMEIVVNRGFRGEVSELVDFYNLDAIISVGYRVNSSKATRFRQWATAILNEYIRKGFVLDDILPSHPPARYISRASSMAKPFRIYSLMIPAAHKRNCTPR